MSTKDLGPRPRVSQLEDSPTPHHRLGLRDTPSPSLPSMRSTECHLVGRWGSVVAMSFCDGLISMVGLSRGLPNSTD